MMVAALTLVPALSGCSSQRSDLDPAALLVDEWHYDKPVVEVRGTSVLGKLGKPLAKSKLKKKVNDAFKKLKIGQRWQSLQLTADERWTLRVVGLTIGGTYTFKPEQGTLTLRWHGVPVTMQARVDSKHLYLMADTDRLLRLLAWISGLSDSETLQAIAFLNENYDDVHIGFQLKR